MGSGVFYDQRTADTRRLRQAIATEARGVEEGHPCRWDARRALFVVKSDSGRTYELTVSMVDGYLVVSCTCPNGVKGRQREPGRLTCKHRTQLARRLERNGFATFGDDGRWRVTPRLLEVVRFLGGAHVFGRAVEGGEPCS